MKLFGIDFSKSIKAKLLSSFLISITLIYVVVISVVSYRSTTKARSEAERITDGYSREYANYVSSELNVYMDAVRLLSQHFSDFKKVEMRQRRSYYNNMLKNLLEKNDSYLSLWTIWEPRSLDTLDRYYENAIGSTAIGNYSPTFYKDKGRILLEDNADTTETALFQSDYYTIPKKRKRETITKPNDYAYSKIESEAIYQTNLISPIIADNEFKGVIGLDVPLAELQEKIDSIDAFDKSKAFLVTNEGVVVTHPNQKFLKRNILEFFTESKDLDFLLKKIQKGESESFNYKDSDGEKYYVSFAPVNVGRTGTPWSVGVMVPHSVIMADSYNQILISILISTFGIFLMALMIIIISRRIAQPITNTTEILKDLSLGRLDQAKEIKVETKDELGEMAKALNKLAVSLKHNAEFANQIGEGNFDKKFNLTSKDDILGNALLKMQINLQHYAQQRDRTNWMQTATMEVSDALRGEKSPIELGDELLSIFANLIDVKLGAMYLFTNEKLKITSSYAFDNRRASSLEFVLGEGMIGQAVKEKKIIHFNDVPEDYMQIQSAFGAIKPSHITIIPLFLGDDIIGVIELGFTSGLDEDQIKFIHACQESVSIGFNSIKVKFELDDLVKKTLEQSDKMQLQQEQLQQQNEEMQVQQEQLKRSNEELEFKSKDLQKSEENLQSQQEELRVINEELEEKTKSLENEKKKVTEQNENLEEAKTDLERKASELESSSQYKSEFLANMSHELRTPLNSLLILSKNLSENKEKNLVGDQVESLDIIYNSGCDLLKLINDILDLSKIESGKMSLNFENTETEEFVDNLNQNFRHVAMEKGLHFNVNTDSDFPGEIYTDFQRLGQVLKNLISNAIKFTQEGSVDITFANLKDTSILGTAKLRNTKCMAITVKDTGIGVPEDKKKAIFEAFQQADGSTSRKYGGTGLGLSISRELCKLLGGEIQLNSVVGEGSEFIIYLPIIDYKEDTIELPNVNGNGSVSASENKVVTSKPEKKEFQEKRPSAKQLRTIESFKDDRDNIDENSRLLMIVEDDVYFAKILYKQAKSKGFQCIVAHRGSEGLALAEKYVPGAIVLDINLPDIDGLKILDNLKKNPETRHIAVHMMSAYEETMDAFNKGAIGYTTKPVSIDELDDAFVKIEHFIDRDMKELLIIEDDENLRRSIKLLIGEKGIKITDAASGQEALDLVKNKKFDCMVLDLGLPDMTGFELLKKLKEQKNVFNPPVIVYTGKEISREENTELQKYAKSIIIKGVKSEERLLDETALFLHRVVKELPEAQQNIISNLHDKNRLFKNKKVLIVDDDMRNVFALTKVLKEKDIEVLRAENGKVGIEVLNSNPDIDLILMDIMMPVMDGYEAINKIRGSEDFKEIPIIALTAKAMKKDQEKCMEVGASDYLSKPLNLDRLFSLMRVWLYNN